MKVKTAFLYTPYLFLAGFFLFYGLSALYWPGGHRRAPDAPGFSFVYNYFCDHLHHSSFNHSPNPGRPHILISLGFLVGSFLTFWAGLVNFWFFNKKLKLISNVYGLVVIGAFCLLPVFHDPAVVAASLLGFTKFFFLHIFLFRQGEFAALGVSFGLAVLVIINFYCWRTGRLEVILPLLQKFAFGAYAFWVGFLTWRVLLYNK